MQLIPYRDVILVKNTKGILSAAIRFLLKSEYSHSEFVIDDWLTFGTDFSRPASIHTFGYNMHEIDIYRLKVPLNSKQIDIIKEYLQNALKLKYDVIEAVCVGLNLKCRGKSNRFICISINLDAYEKAGALPVGTSNLYKDFTSFSQSSFFEKVEMK